MNEYAEQKPARTFSRIGLGCALMGLITYGISLVAGNVLSLTSPDLLSGRIWIAYAIQYGALYLIGFPVFLLLIRRLPRAERTEQKTLGAGKFFAVLCICFLATIIGSLVSNLLNSLLSDSFGLDVSELVQNALLGMEWYTRILLAVVIAPLMEELIFRKLMIDRMRLYGERLAVVTSGLMFGLFHGNLSQVVYASLLGWIFGYLYLRTGKLRYSIILHFIINGMSTLVSLLLTSMDTEAMQAMLETELTDPEAILSLVSPAVIGIALISLLQYALAIAGIVMLILNIRKVHFHPAARELPRGKRFVTVWLNPGMLMFLAVVIGEFAISYLAAG